jgi:hypothetical protein
MSKVGNTVSQFCHPISIKSPQSYAILAAENGKAPEDGQGPIRRWQQATKQRENNVKSNWKRIGVFSMPITLLLTMVAACTAPTSAVPTAAPATPTVPAATEPAATEPAATEPAATEPAATEAAVALPVSDITSVDESGNTTIDQTSLSAALGQISGGELSIAEVEGLLYMREEEKLAKDVYLTLCEKWGMSTFQNIANAEQTHMDAVRTLIERYGLEDPAEASDIGVFTNSTLQDLYDQLVETGNQSLGDALRVGAAIEEIDILDLEEYIAQTDKADIQVVYESLMKGSRNHLRSFVSTLKRQEGQTYEPQYLSQEAYDAIVSTPTEAGGEGRGP